MSPNVRDTDSDFRPRVYTADRPGAGSQTALRRLAHPFIRFGQTAVTVTREHAAYRLQILQLARADLVKTYRGAALGWAWAPVKPAVTIFVFWFAFAIALRSGAPVNGVPFFLWLIAGIVPWFYMSEMITQGSQAFNRYSYLVTKIQYPVSTIPTFVSLSKLLVHLVLLVLVTLIFIIWGYPVDIYFLQLPLYAALMFAFFTAWSLFSSPLSAVSKDFSNTVNSFVTAIFWLSGILWDVNTIEITWLQRLLLLNPVTFFATGYRNVFVYKRWFFEDEYALAAFVLVGVLTVCVAIFTYGRLRHEIADVL